MYRLLIIGMLLLAVPTILLAQEDKAKDAAADKAKGDEKDKPAADKDKPVTIIERTTIESMTSMPPAQVFADLAILILLCLVYFQGMMTRSELKEMMEKMAKPS
jgi:hypothetical protein